MSTFKNCILLVVFNWSDCVNNKNTIKKLYENHFKQIIFYSDFPEKEDDDVTYIDIKMGYTTTKIFEHFYKNYKLLLEDSDGLFFTMDDNIINVNILHLFDTRKIIYSYNQIKPLTAYVGWWWDYYSEGNHGRKALVQLIEDDEFKQYTINKFSGVFSDFFFLPKQYLTPKLFHLFQLFSKYEVFLEIAIPSIINNLEQDVQYYQPFSQEILWSKSDRDKFLNKDYIYNCLHHNHNLFLHPIKFIQNPETRGFVEEILCKEKCVIITTINKPTETILKHINNKDYDVIIVGDEKTPNDYKNLHCIFLDIPSQDMLFPELSKLLPYNHYSRKNLGYLYAIKKGYKVIYETDDDNIPFDTFDNVLQLTNTNIITEQNNPWINIFKYFTFNNYIWPRGFPLSLLKQDPNYLIEDTDKKPSIINGLVKNDPDVDALFRIICNHQSSIVWEEGKSVLINNKNVCVFNTQNTFWLNPDLFICLFLPCSVSFRYCDILRSIITNIILKKTDTYMMYTSPNVIQHRNQHDLMSDFKSEYEMYIHNETILNIIEKNTDTILSVKELLITIYNNLLSANIIKQADVDILKKWIAYF